MPALDLLIKCTSPFRAESARKPDMNNQQSHAPFPKMERLNSAQVTVFDLLRIHPLCLYYLINNSPMGVIL